MLLNEKGRNKSGGKKMSETMKALVYHGKENIALEVVPKPQIMKPNDVIGKVTGCAICTSDLHIYEGYFPMLRDGLILGHEFCVEVSEVGEAVKDKYKVGDHYVVIPMSYCDECMMCKMGARVYCQNGGGFGLKQNGATAEYIRIPDPDSCMYKVPDGLTDDDVLLVPDMFATARFGIENAHVKAGQTIAVVGLGPVGFCACSLLKNVYKCNVIAITGRDSSLELAKEHNIADYTFNSHDPELVQKVMAVTGRRGVPAVIETAGNQNSLDEAFAIVGKGGIVSTIATFNGSLSVPFNVIAMKDVSIVTGVQRAEGVAEMLEYVKQGVLDTKFMITHKVSLDDVMEGYKIFGLNGKREDGCIKVVVVPGQK